MSNPTYCPTCGARDDAKERGLAFDANGIIAELIAALRAKLNADDDEADMAANVLANNAIAKAEGK